MSEYEAAVWIFGMLFVCATIIMVTRLIVTYKEPSRISERKKEQDVAESDSEDN